MIRIPDVKDYDKIYGFYKEKTLYDKVFVLIEKQYFFDILKNGFIAIHESDSDIDGLILSHQKDEKSYITILYGDLIDIKSSLLLKYEEEMLKQGIKESWLHFFNPYCLSWYPQKNATHPCYQGVLKDSELETFYLLNNYQSHSIQDTYYLDLNQFIISDDIKNQININKKDDIEIAFYDSQKHNKIIEFTDQIQTPHWKNVIINNLNQENPLPLLVALKHNEVIGFTGPLSVEKSGRGYFAGIGVLETERGKKIGKTLFFMLCQTLKDMGSSYMTLYTGRDNLARFIYLSAGFKVVKSFVTMKKTY